MNEKNSRKPISFVSGRATQPTFSSSFPTFLWETDMCRRLRIYLLRFVCFWFFFRLGKILVPWLAGKLLGYVMFFCILEKRESPPSIRKPDHFLLPCTGFCGTFSNNQYAYIRQENKTSIQIARVFRLSCPAYLTTAPPKKQRRRRRRTTNHVAFFLFSFFWGGERRRNTWLGSFSDDTKWPPLFFGVSALITGQPATLRRVGGGGVRVLLPGYASLPFSLSFFLGGDHLEVLFVKVSPPPLEKRRRTIVSLFLGRRRKVDAWKQLLGLGFTKFFYKKSCRTLKIERLYSYKKIKHFEIKISKLANLLPPRRPL